MYGVMITYALQEKKERRNAYTAIEFSLAL